MNKPIFYKAPPKWHSFAAVIGAVALELAAVGVASLATNKRIPFDNGVPEEHPIDGVVIEEPSESTPPPLEDLAPPLPPPPTDITDFVLTEPSPPPATAVRVRSPVERTAHASGGTVNFRTSQSNMIFSPHPAYPFEARKTKQTGSGKFLLRFNSNGDVTEVLAVQSTGSAVLDETSLSALRQWRCKPGVYDKVYVPITFTLQGVQL
jgi:TonB family protein